MRFIDQTVRCVFCLSVAGVVLWAGTATAQLRDTSEAGAQGEDGALSEIIVTATKQGESRLQDTPLAISAFTGAQLNQTLSANIQDLAEFVPSLNISKNTTNPVITLRGIGTNNVFNGSDPDVTMQVDGVYIARPSAMSSDFLDVERVEVLRGPQGTLYGRNAVGGTINVISRAPTDEPTGQVVLTGGNFGLFQGQAYMSGGLIPGRVQASLSGTFTRHGNWEENRVPGVDGVDNANHGGLRGQIRIEITDRIDATTRADWTSQNEYFDVLDHLLVPFKPAVIANSLIGDYTKVAINTPSVINAHNWGVSEDVNFVLSDHLQLKSISAYRKSLYALQTDNDGTEVRNIVGHFAENEQQKSQELDVSGDSGPFSGVAGAYYFDERAGTNVFAQLYGPGVKINSLPRFYARSIAGFAQGTYAILPSLKLTAGVRYTTEKKDIDTFVQRTFFLTTGAPLPGFPVAFSNDARFHATTPKVGLDWKVTDDTLLYVSATKGYKSGGSNYAAASRAAAGFNPETLWSYEGGFKTDLFNHSVRLNMAAFHYDYKNLQIQSVLVPGVVTILNAASAKVDGIEAELSAKLTRGLRIDASLSGLHARYTSFPNASVANALGPLEVGNPDFSPNPVPPTAPPGSQGGSFNAQGNYLNQAPRYSGDIAAQYDFNLKSGASIMARADVYYQDRAYYEPSNSFYQSQGAYAVLNAQLGYRFSDSWQIRLWAKNLTDRHYLIAFQANGVEPAGTADAPRTYGVRLNYEF